MRKPNPLLAQFEAKLEAQYKKKLHIMQQLGLDAATISANEILQCGTGRAPAFRNRYVEVVNEIARMIVEDSEGDPDILWTKAKLDERIKAIVGEENFVPWDERYRMTYGKEN